MFPHSVRTPRSAFTIVLSAVLLTVVSGLAVGQTAAGANDAPAVSGVDTFEYIEAIVEDFESDPSWRVETTAIGPVRPEDPEFAVVAALRPEAPFDLQVDSGQSTALGVKITSSQYGHYIVRLLAQEPVPLPEGTPITLSAWIAAENRNHSLFALVLDGAGGPFAELSLGRANFSGWRQVTATLPADIPESAHPLQFAGFAIVTDPLDTGLGADYLFLDAVSVVSRTGGAGAEGPGTTTGGGK